MSRRSVPHRTWHSPAANAQAAGLTHAELVALAGYRPAAALAAAASASTRAGRQLIRVRSTFARMGAVHPDVELDVLGRNPLLEDLQKSDPTTYARALRNNAGTPPPTLFASGADLPIFTASGVEPQALLRLPWVARHAAAAEPDRGKVAAIFEACSGGDEAAWHQALLVGQGHRGNTEYVARLKAWADAFPEDPSTKSDVGWV